MNRLPVGFIWLLNELKKWVVKRSRYLPAIKDNGIRLSLKLKKLIFSEMPMKKAGECPLPPMRRIWSTWLPVKRSCCKNQSHNFALELTRCNQLGVPYVVLHPGSHGGDGVEAGLERFTRGWIKQ